MAAGMGSRYGGLKQMDGLGPCGETIIDYSIYDAMRAGFGKVVFVIRRDFEDDFRKLVISKFEDRIPVCVAFQDLDKLPGGYKPDPARVKPWGTNHAVLVGREYVSEPFAVINGDDFYGRRSFEVLADRLRAMEGRQNDYCMVGFPVRNTLSESGTVSRGVCSADADGYLTSIVEHTKIEEIGGRIVNHNPDGSDTEINPDVPVSMNMWGFTPDYFDHSEKFFLSFLKDNASSLTAEFYIPTMVDYLIKNKTATVKVLATTSKWFGVTYKEDKASVISKINELIVAGEYPGELWG